MIHEAPTVGFKVCAHCGERKRVLAFAACHSAHDGLAGECRDCVSMRAAAYAHTHPRAHSAIDPRIMRLAGIQ